MQSSRSSSRNKVSASGPQPSLPSIVNTLDEINNLPSTHDTTNPSAPRNNFRLKASVSPPQSQADARLRFLSPSAPSTKHPDTAHPCKMVGMATNGTGAFAPVLSAMATMRDGQREQKIEAHEYLEKFQKSVS